MIYSCILLLFGLDSMAQSAFSGIYCLSCYEKTLHFLLCQCYKVAMPHASLYVNEVLSISIIFFAGF